MKNRDITFVTKDGVAKGVVNILGKVTTLTHKTVQTFEDTVEVEQPAELLEKSLDRQSVYWKALPLLPGLYRLDIAIKDVNNPDHMGYYGRSLEVPDLPRRKAGHLFADPGRPDEHGRFALDRQRQLRHRQHLHPASREQPQSRPTAGQIQAQPATQLLDAGLQSGHRRGHQEQPGHGDLPDRQDDAATATLRPRTPWFLKNNWIPRNWARTAIR